MTGVARLRRWFIEQHQIAADVFVERMARPAANFLMPAFQWKPRPIVIEKRWLPLITIVAIRAGIHPRSKLIGVWVLVTIAAIDGGFREVHVTHIEFHRGRFVAIDTCNAAVRAK